MAARQEPIELPTPSADDNKVVEGRDGFYFLANDSNRIFDQLAGEYLFTDEQVAQWHSLLETRCAWSEHSGCPFFFMVGPDAHYVYPDKLPEGAVLADRRPIHQLLERLDEQRSFAHAIYPLERLIAERDRAVFAKTGSHWSEIGAFVGYLELIEEMRKRLPDLRALGFDDIVISDDDLPGDLGFKVDPPVKSKYVFVDVIDSRTRLVADNRVARNGRRVEFEGDESLEGTCLLMGDSFSVRVAPILAESFRRLVYAHLTTFDFELAREVNPDVIVMGMNERCMINVPVDLPAESQRMLEARKIASGDVLPPRKAETNRLNLPRLSKVGQAQ